MTSKSKRPEQLRMLLRGFISLFFLIGGIGHFVVTDKFIAIMPDWLGWHVELVLISGVFEILGAIGLLLPATRKWAGLGLIALAIAVLPANINMALHPERFADIPVALLYIRLPLQLLLIAGIWVSSQPRPDK